MHSRYTFAVLGVTIVGTFLVGESVASAQGVIYACASNSSGAIRVVFAGSNCKSNESPLQWNVADSRVLPAPRAPQAQKML